MTPADYDGDETIDTAVFRTTDSNAGVRLVALIAVARGAVAFGLAVAACRARHQN